MMLENFTIEPSLSEIRFSDQITDLHNNYEFSGLNISRIEKKAEIIFIKAFHALWTSAIPRELKIQFEGVDNVWQKEHDAEVLTFFKPEDVVPDLLGFSEVGTDIMDGPASHFRERRELQALIFTFVTGKSIKIQAETARLVVS
jgi:hypothetical protein